MSVFLKQITVKNHIFPAREESDVEDVGFDEILEEMCPEGKLRHHAAALVGHLDKYRRIADLMKTNGNTQARCRGAPSARAKQDCCIRVLLPCQAVQLSD